MPDAPERDRAFAHAVYDAAIRCWLTLEFVLKRHLSRPWDQTDPKLRGALLVASAQMLALDRVPASAAINHAVEWAKQQVGPGPAKAANAVLRRVLADLGGDARHEPSRRRSTFGFAADELPLGGTNAGCFVLPNPILPEDELERLAIVTSHPIELVRTWLATRSPAQVRTLCLHGMCDAPIVLNVDHARHPLPSGLAAEHDDPGNSVFTGPRARLGELLDSDPGIWVQDAASCRAVRSLRGSGAGDRPRVIIDACAGLGTKTRQLAAEFPDALVVASDVDEERFASLSRTFAGSEQVRIVPSAQLRERWHGRADLVLLDVPCSNTGVLARRPEARYRAGAKAFESLAGIQRQIIADAIPLLAENPRGSILYSTCSLEPAENRQQAEWAVKWHRFVPERESVVEPAGLPGDPPRSYRDGAYSVLLRG